MNFQVLFCYMLGVLMRKRLLEMCISKIFSFVEALDILCQVSIGFPQPINRNLS